MGLGIIYNILWLKTQSWSGKCFHACLKLSDGTQFLFHIILCRHLVMLQYSSFVIPSMQSCHSGSGSSSITRCTKRKKKYTSPIHQSNTSVSYNNYSLLIECIHKYPNAGSHSGWNNWVRGEVNYWTSLINGTLSKTNKPLLIVAYEDIKSNTTKEVTNKK